MCIDERLQHEIGGCRVERVRRWNVCSSTRDGEPYAKRTEKDGEVWAVLIAQTHRCMPVDLPFSMEAAARKVITLDDSGQLKSVAPA